MKSLGRKMWMRPAFSSDPQIQPSIVFDSAADFEAAAYKIFEYAWGSQGSDKAKRFFFETEWPELRKRILGE